MAESRIIFWNPGTASIGEATCAIGAFDGVHSGHRYLIEGMVADAHQRGVASMVVTFDIDPDELFRDRDTIAKLLTNEDRISMLAELGADYVLVLPFTHALAAHDTLGFLKDYLIPCADMRCIHVGHDFRLGVGNGGGVGDLSAWGHEHGCDCIGYELLCLGDQPVTATRIRELLREGDVETAAVLLGRPHYVKGTVVHGRGAGKHDFDIPTANIETDVLYTPLKDGVYAGYVTFDGMRHPAAINVGIPPTFSDARCPLEPHIIDYSGDLYGREVAVSFVKRLRDLIRFESSEELITTVGENIAWVREHLT